MKGSDFRFLYFPRMLADMNAVTSDSPSTSSLEASPPEHQSPSNSDDDPLIPLSKWRRRIVLFSVCWMVFPMNFASSSILAAAPEVASSFHVPTTSISVANAGVFLGMAASPLIWAPIENIMGRRASYITASVSLCLCSIGSALAPTMAVFTVIWILGGTTAVVCLTAGQTLISDCYKPVRRNTVYM
jgi:MFS family permease